MEQIGTPRRPTNVVGVGRGDPDVSPVHDRLRPESRLCGRARPGQCRDDSAGTVERISSGDPDLARSDAWQPHLGDPGTGRDDGGVRIQWHLRRFMVAILARAIILSAGSAWGAVVPRHGCPGWSVWRPGSCSSGSTSSCPGRRYGRRRSGAVGLPGDDAGREPSRPSRTTSAPLPPSGPPRQPAPRSPGRPDHAARVCRRVARSDG